MANRANLWKSADRRAFGGSRRQVVSRVAQGKWDGKGRKHDPLEILTAADRGRISKLLPIKWERMAASPFGFFRGAVSVMAADLAMLPRTGIELQICGDAHVRNLGFYSSVDGHLIFDINDFDETIWGPWEWDVKRLATSIVLVAREAGQSESKCGAAVGAFAEAYVKSIQRLSRMSILEAARYRMRLTDCQAISAALSKSERATPLHNLEQLTSSNKKGTRRFRESKPLLNRVEKNVRENVLQALRAYRETLPDERRHFYDLYRPIDVAFKVVGTGSVGARDYVVLLIGNDEKDPLFLQLKEESASAYTQYLPKLRRYSHQGKRVVDGYRRVQTQSDLFLGWTSIENKDYLVRQLNDHKSGIDFSDLRGKDLLEYARVCADVLAKGHSRSGDACMIAGYLGEGAKFQNAIQKFAISYADQTAQDQAKFVAALKRRTTK